MASLQLICGDYLREWKRIVRRESAKASEPRRYRGISFRKDKGKWEAAIKCGKRRLKGGYHDTQEAAAMARDRLATELYGDKAKLNFPNTTN